MNCLHCLPVQVPQVLVRRTGRCDTCPEPQVLGTAGTREQGL